MQHQLQCLRKSHGMSQCRSMSLDESGPKVTHAIAACDARIGISVGRKGYKSEMICKEHSQVVQIAQGNECAWQCCLASA